MNPRLLRNSLVITVLGFALAGCSVTTPKVLVKPELYDRPELIVPSVQPIVQSEMSWIVLTPDNYERKIKELEAAGKSVTLFALSSQGYRNLSMNVAELRKYIQQQNSVIAAYKKYYKNEEKKPAKK